VALARSAARRYAEAAFEIALRDDSMEAWSAAMAVAEERLTDAEVTRLLSNPSLPAGDRIEVLGRILGEAVTGAPRNLLALMIRRGRFEQLPAVVREFRRLYREREGIVEATVSSAAPLDAAALAAVRTRLAHRTSKPIELDQQTDAELLGGLVVRVGDQLIDGSVRGRLERLRNDLTTTTI
jgi:F-type H+-transporting ATPase subunit delta